jgi:hypothetical protein
MLVSSASAGHINVRGAGGSANLAGTGGVGATLDWGADAEAGYDLWGYVDELGDEFDSTMVYADAASSDYTSVEADLKELSISGEVSGPEGSYGSAFAAASGQALGWEDASAEIDTWLFAHTATYAGYGATAKASATASGTTEGTGWDDVGSEISAKSSGTVSATSSVKSDDYISSEAASVAAIGASAFLGEENAVRAGYEYIPYCEEGLSDFSDGYLYPGNGLMAVSEVEGTGTAKATAAGSATSGGSSEAWGDFSFEAGASGAVSSAVSAKDEAMSFGLSAIHAWVFQSEAVHDPVAVGDTGTSILTGGAAMSEDSKASATMTASGKSSASMSYEESEVDAVEGPLMANIESASSGAITSKVSSTDEGEVLTGSIITGRAVAYPGDDIEWGILLPAAPGPMGYLAFSAGAGEGGLYTLIGSASEARAADGKASADVTMSGKASANGDGISGEYPEQYGKIAGSASSNGEISSKTKASNGGEALSTSQIAALGGEGPFAIEEHLSYGMFAMFPPLEFTSEVGGMSYLTTSAAVESGYDDSASVKSSVSGSSAFEGKSFIVGDTDEYHAAETVAKGTVTADASAKDTAFAAVSSTIFSKAFTEAHPLIASDGGAMIIDYSLIMSDAVADSNSGTSGSAKGSAEGSTSASGHLIYETLVGSLWVTEEAKSTTSADGAMKAEAKASGDSDAYAVAELKSLNIVLPETELGPYPIMTVDEDSNLVSFAHACGMGTPGTKSSAKVQMTGKTASEGSVDYNVLDLGTEIETPYHIEAETAVSNADKVTASGSASLTYDADAMSYAVSSAQAANGLGKMAETAGMFGTWAMGYGKVKAEAKIDTVKVSGYADPDGVEAEIGASGGAASAKVNPPKPSKAPPPSYSGSLKGDFTDAASTAIVPEYAESHVYMESMDKTTLKVPIEPMVPSEELVHPLIFWLPVA